jgi:hypothetical protein
VDLAVDQTVVRVQPKPVQHDEHVVGVELQLRTLPPPQTVLDRELVQVEARAQLLELVRRRVGHVDPEMAARAQRVADGPRVERTTFPEDTVVDLAACDHTPEGSARRRDRRGRRSLPESTSAGPPTA